MFIKTQKFKALLRESYKNGSLRLYRPNKEDLVIMTGYCIMNIVMKEMTAKEKAAVIEFAGNFPEVGEAFKCGEEGNQQIIEQTLPEDIWELDHLWEQGSDEYEQTYVMVDAGSTMVRAVQNIGDNTVIWFQDRLINCTGAKDMTMAETTPEHFRINGPMYLMKNNILTMGVLKFDLKNSKLNRLLENMELYGNARKDDSAESLAESD